jgi:hypothetical protein
VHLRPDDLTVEEFIEVIDAVEAGAPPPEGAFEAGAVFSAPARTIRRSSI